MWALLPLVLLGGLFFVFMVLPQRRQMQAIAAMQARLAVGDEVITTSGIYGRVTTLDADTVDLEIAPGVALKLVRRAIGRRVADLEAAPDGAPPATPAVDDDGGAR